MASAIEWVAILQPGNLSNRTPTDDKNPTAMIDLPPLSRLAVASWEYGDFHRWTCLGRHLAALTFWLMCWDKQMDASHQVHQVSYSFIPKLFNIWLKPDMITWLNQGWHWSPKTQIITPQIRINEDEQWTLSDTISGLILMVMTSLISTLNKPKSLQHLSKRARTCRPIYFQEPDSAFVNTPKSMTRPW